MNDKQTANKLWHQGRSGMELTPPQIPETKVEPLLTLHALHIINS